MKSIKKIALFAVGDDAWQGGIQYITNIMNALHQIAMELVIEVHLFKNSIQHFPDISKFNNIKIVIHSVEQEFKPFSIYNRVIWYLQRRFMQRVNPRIENMLLNYNFDYVFPSTLSHCNHKLNVAAWIADFQFHYFPAGAEESIISAAHTTIGQIVDRSDKIILSSKFCEADCFKFYPASKGKTYVMPFSVFVDNSLLEFKDFDILIKKYCIPERYIMIANLFAPTKNHKTLFHALGILRKKGLLIPLICTGNLVDYRNQAFANEILKSITEHQIRSQVHLLGLIPRSDQIQLYRKAAALIQPSLSEGWSTLVEEGKALGKNIILSDIEVHKEQYPNNPYFYHSLDPIDLADKIENLWVNQKNINFPQVDTEKEAWLQYQEKVKEFGKNFLDIAAA